MDKILRNKKAIFIFIAPALIMFVLVLVIPMVQMVYYSLCDYAALTPPKFTGLANYKKLFFQDSTFKIALKNSIFFMIFSAITQQVIGLGLAVMLTNIKKGRNLFKNIYYLPSVLSSAALGLLWAFMFNPKIGINNLLAQFGIKGPLWLMDSKGFIVLPMWVIAFVALWQYVGQNMMLYMAQITGISRDIYEASYIDGASKTQSFRYITLPLLRPVIITMVMLSVGRIFYSDFGLFYQIPMNSGTIYSTTNVIDTYVYRGLLQQGNIGMSAAAGLYQSVVGFIIVLIANGIVRKIDKDSAFI